jgi:hypothetical protein
LKLNSKKFRQHINLGYKHKWGYMGTETTINGLVKWLDNRVDLKANLNDKMEVYYQMIIDFGINNIDGLKPKQKPRQMANQIARKINEQNSFSRFVQYIKTNYNVLEKPRTTHF